MITTSHESMVKKEEQKQLDKKKLRKILQPRDTVYVVYGNWGTKKQK